MKPVSTLSDDDFSHLVQRAVRELPDAPLAWQQAAVQLFPAVGLGAAFKALVHGGAAHIAALLSFDSWAMPAAAAGARTGRSATRHLLFNAEGRDIDLRITPGPGAQTWVLTGQILGPDDTGTVELLPQTDPAAQARSATLDDLGEFRIDDLRRGTYLVTLRLGTAAVVLPPVEVGEPTA